MFEIPLKQVVAFAGHCSKESVARTFPKAKCASRNSATHGLTKNLKPNTVHDNKSGTILLANYEHKLIG